MLYKVSNSVLPEVYLRQSKPSYITYI